jgi:hypothetical protein
MIWLLSILGVFAIQVIHLSIVLEWSDERTAGLNYYGLPPARPASLQTPAPAPRRDSASDPVAECPEQARLPQCPHHL